jgi:hypothetical protein
VEKHTVRATQQSTAATAGAVAVVRDDDKQDSLVFGR